MEKKPIDITWQIKKAELKQKAKEKYNSVKTWCANNTELALAIGSGVVGVVGWVAKTAVKAHSQHKEEAIKNLYWYDPSLGKYWRLKHSLSNKECLEVDRRHANGERLADILDSMKVLK